MHTVELLEELLAAATQLGYAIRAESLDGNGGGCEIAGRKHFFLDLSQTPAEQLQQLADTLRDDQAARTLPLSPPAARLLQPPQARKAA